MNDDRTRVKDFIFWRPLIGCCHPVPTLSDDFGTKGRRPVATAVVLFSSSFWLAVGFAVPVGPVVATATLILCKVQSMGSSWSAAYASGCLARASIARCYRHRLRQADGCLGSAVHENELCCCWADGTRRPKTRIRGVFCPSRAGLSALELPPRWPIRSTCTVVCCNDLGATRERRQR
ncbi:hypothetical protein BCV70DRAFT_103297 [Testicularia cyperi]|uniref:Uncharacterized protein n=1 Tax=Testicularia cyperi TaxID=1882483 RepID=A0A317XRP6_9BASI|nr:hypothetical protein BCV70DRAFT_103297 [Testicularia cyperi]